MAKRVRSSRTNSAALQQETNAVEYHPMSDSAPVQPSVTAQKDLIHDQRDAPCPRAGSKTARFCRENLKCAATLVPQVLC